MGDLSDGRRNDRADEVGWEEARREFLADERDRIADERERLADEREADADLREQADGERLGLEPSAGERHRAALAASKARQEAAEARQMAREVREKSRSSRDERPTLLAQSFAKIAGQLFAAGNLDDVFNRIVRAAVRLIPGCTACSITVVQSDGPSTKAAFGPGALEADEAQYEAGDGPCLQAVSEPVIFSPQVSTDPRWPILVPRYRSELETVASFGLYEAWSDPREADPPGSLNVYAAGINALDDHEIQLGLLLAAHASSAMLIVGQLNSSRHAVANLTAALATRDVIGQAKGILMERSKVTADQAFDILREASQTYNRKLRDIAEALVFSGEVPSPEPTER